MERGWRGKGGGIGGIVKKETNKINKKKKTKRTRKGGETVRCYLQKLYFLLLELIDEIQPEGSANRTY